MSFSLRLLEVTLIPTSLGERVEEVLLRLSPSLSSAPNVLHAIKRGKE